MNDHASPVVPVSWGELLDKIMILEIKQTRIKEPEAQKHVAKELRLLRAIAAPAMDQIMLAPLLARLKTVNEALWEIEDSIRSREATGDFGADFLRLARSVYKNNDERAVLKREINILLKSDLFEEKSYDHPSSAVSAAISPHANASPR